MPRLLKDSYGNVLCDTGNRTKTFECRFQQASIHSIEVQYYDAIPLNDETTKALSMDGNTLNAHWLTGETVAVYLGGDYKGLLTATVNPSDNTKAALSGELTDVEGIAENSVLTLLFPRALWDYTGQDGTEPSETGSLATYYDYATASVTVASVSGSTVTTTGGAVFTNDQSMYRFGFKAGGAGDLIEIKEFTVSSAHNALYLGSKAIPAQVMDVQGRFISAQSISVTKSDLAKSGTASEVW